MLDQKQQKNKFNKKIKKSHICLFGSLLVILGSYILLHQHIIQLKMKLFSDMQMSFNEDKNIEETIDGLPNLLELPKEEPPIKEEEVKEEKKIDYSKYLGVLEIPRINLKRGFYGTDSRYNNISYNVTLVGGSTMPDKENGNLILMAHSGNASISYFAYLFLLKIGDTAYVTYQGNVYKYQIVNIYNVPKVGTVKINRNKERTTLTLITCTHGSDVEQTIYILERI